MKRTLTKTQGVYQRKSSERTFKGMPDICYDISYKYEGKKKWEKIGWLSEGYSEKLAAGIRGDRIRDIRHGEELPHEKAKVPLFKDAVVKYLAWSMANKKSGPGDESLYRNYLSDFFDNKRLDKISPFELERFKKHLQDTKRYYIVKGKVKQKKPLSPATIKHALVLIRHIFNKAITWGMYKGENPIKGIKMPALQNQRERFLSYEEASLLLEELKKVSRTTHDMAVIALHCGLRANEIFSLKGYDVDLINNLITIANPKNKQPRKAHMTEAVKAILSGRIPEKPADYIFKDTRHGGKINGISQAYRQLANRLFNNGIKDARQRVTFHTLRHTFASWLALQGESLITLRELLGHKSFAMTQRYSHLMPDQKKRAITALEKAFNESNKVGTLIQGGLSG